MSSLRPYSEFFNDLCSQESLNLDAFPFFDSSRARAVSLVREMSCDLVDETGQLSMERLAYWSSYLKNQTTPLNPAFDNDGVKRLDMLHTLEALKDQVGLSKALYKIKKPHANLSLDRMIKQTLGMDEREEVTDIHTKRAVLAALIFPLRQSVGSCFATAPAILVQSQYPHQFLGDMEQIMDTGCLRRVVEGEEYSVPFSYHWGMGEWYSLIPLNLKEKITEKSIIAHSILSEALKATGLEGDWEELLQAQLKKLGSWKLISAAELIQALLMAYFQLNSDEIEAFKKQEDIVVTNDFLPPVSQQEVGKFALCKRYLSALSKAKIAFMSFADLALLKGWEFTLASLSESKANFATWNLYTALGLQAESAHGVGWVIKTYLSERLDQINHEIEEYELKYDHLLAAAKSLEGRIERSESQRQMQWAMADYQLRKQEIHRILVERDELHEKGRLLASLFPSLVQFYTKEFMKYFQEVYDARMQEISQENFDDSPAGFRLLYKHGRSNPALWTLIFSGAEYVKALVSFFVSTEIELLQDQRYSGVKKEMGALITQIIQEVRKPEFIEASQARLKNIYQGHSSKTPRTPWAYISGGVMATLVSCYFGCSEKLKEKARWVESSKELLAFWLDTIRDLPYETQARFKAHPEEGLLAFSPTHAFQLKPGWSKFREGWDGDHYAYTWIRDHYIQPQQLFLENQKLNHKEIEFIFLRLLSFLPDNDHTLLSRLIQSFPFQTTPKAFRDNLFQCLRNEQWPISTIGVQRILDQCDSLLYEHLPFLTPDAFHAYLKMGMAQLKIRPPENMYQKVLLRLEDATMYTSEILAGALKTLRALEENKSFTEVGFEYSLYAFLREKGLKIPEPVLVGDTNWEGRYFGFTVNPGTDEYELWMFNRQASKGQPMSVWKAYLNGASKQEWGVYTDPIQYTPRQERRI